MQILPSLEACAYYCLNPDLEPFVQIQLSGAYLTHKKNHDTIFDEVHTPYAV